MTIRTQETPLTGTHCPICLAAESAPFYVKNGYLIVECAACHMRFVSPLPTAEELNAHYQQAAYFSGENDQGYLNYADMKKALQPHFQRRLQILEDQASATRKNTGRGLRGRLFSGRSPAARLAHQRHGTLARDGAQR